MSAIRINSFGNFILSVHVRSHLTFIVAPAATGRQAARWGGSQRSSVARHGTTFQVPLHPRQLHAAKPDLACRSGPACLPRLEHQTRLRSAQVHPPPCPRAVCSCRSHSSREWTCAGTHGAQGGECRLGQGFCRFGRGWGECNGRLCRCNGRCSWWVPGGGLWGCGSTVVRVVGL